MNEENILIKIRDVRIKEHFIIDDAYLNGWAKICKPIGTAVYNSLCRHANNETQQSYPSQSLISKQHGVPIKSIRQGIKKLLEYNIISAEKERDKGKFTNYIYTLLDKSEWIVPTIGRKRPTVHHRSETTDGKRPTKDNKDKGLTLSKDRGLAQPTNHRKDIVFPKEIYNSIIEYYQQLKEIVLKGSEFLPVQQTIKSMLIDGRQPKEIMDCMKFMAKDDFYKKNWTIRTVRLKIAEFIAGHLKIKEEIPFYHKKFDIKEQLKHV